MELLIDKEFSLLIPELTKTEKDQLVLNVRNEGCRDAIVVWKNGLPEPTIIDGHNRYEICKTYNLEFAIKEKAFKGRHEAIDWIIDNQLGRRNLTEEQKIYLIGKKYKEEKKEHGGDRGNQYMVTDVKSKGLPSGQNVHLANTAQKIAEQHKVDEKTVRRAEKFADAVDNKEFLS